MSIEVRPLLSDAVDEEAAFQLLLKVDLASFVEDAELEDLKDERGVCELDRAVLAWDDGEPVGCASVYSLQLSVPGGNIPCAGVTWVGVLPTHRRRGVMSAMLNHIHRTAGESTNEPIAGLWASQPPIYPRFGYGRASRHLWVTINRTHGGISSAPNDPSLRLRLIEPAEDAPFTQPVYRRVMEQRPALTALDDRWQARSVSDPKSEREGASSLRTVLVEDEEGVRGFARYSFKHEWDKGYGDGTIRVRQMMANDPAAEAALWRYLIDFDLAGRLDVWNLPVDSPITHWLDQPRHHKQQVGDALYLKFLDLPTALSARTFSGPVDVVVDVTDGREPQNNRRWRISGDEQGSVCAHTTDAADFTIATGHFASAYLGGTPLNELSWCGYIDEHTKGSVRAASNAFSHFPAPWSPFVF